MSCSIAGFDDRDTDLFLCDTNTCQFDGECLRIGDTVTCICDFKEELTAPPAGGSTSQGVWVLVLGGSTCQGVWVLVLGGSTSQGVWVLVLGGSTSQGVWILVMGVFLSGGLGP
ncbi:hypothetical protein NHX12_006810, partial [Muraenolepis orangiensis]